MKKNSILIIDDEPVSLTSICNHLRQLSYQIEVIEKGQRALEKLTKNPYQFSTIILDRVLPDIDSMKLLQKMKSHSALRSIPVIMLTSKADKKETIAAFKNGVYDFLLKPIDKDLLSLVIKRALNDSRNLVIC